MRSDQTARDMSFNGLDHANIFTADGKALTIGDLSPGQRVTLEYAVRDKHWYISKVILSEPRPGADSVVANPASRDRMREASEGEARTPSAPLEADGQAPMPVEKKVNRTFKRTGP